MENEADSSVTVAPTVAAHVSEPVFPALSLGVSEVLTGEYGFEEAVRERESDRPVFHLPTPA